MTGLAGRDRGEQCRVAAGEPLPWWGGVGAAILSATLAPMVAALSIEPLTDPLLWGRAVDDERYAALARLA